MMTEPSEFPAMTPRPHRRWRGTALLLFFLLAPLLFLNRHQWAVDVRNSSDDASYLSYAMSIGLDFDLDFENEIAFPSHMALAYPTPRHFYGAGLMAAPFVALFSIVDRLAGHPVIADHRQFVHSWSYFGFSFAVHVYFLAAAFLYWRSLTLLRREAAILLPFAFCLGSGILYYVLMRPRMSHGFEFLALAVVVYGSLRYWRELLDGSHRPRWLVVAAVGATLAIAVRLSSLNVLILPVLILLLATLDPRATGPRFAGRSFRRAVTLAIVIPFVLFGLVLVTNQVFFGVPFPTPKGLTGYASTGPRAETLAEWTAYLVELAVTLPVIRAIVVGSEFGLIYTNPVIVFGVVAIVGLALRDMGRGGGKAPVLAVAGALVYVLFTLFIAFQQKTPGLSFGWRWLYPLFPLGFVGYGLWWYRGGESRWQPGAWASKSIHVALLGLCGVAVVGSLLFTKTPALGYRPDVNSFGIETLTARGFHQALFRAVGSRKVWDIAISDGVVGFVNKMYVSRTVLRWAFRDVLPGGETAREPNWQHPPVVGLWIAILAGLWIGFAALAARLERRGTSSPSGLAWRER